MTPEQINSSEVRLLKMSYFFYLQDLQEALLLSQLVYWRDSDFCKWKTNHNNEVWLKIDQANMIKSFPWISRTTLWRKLDSLKNKNVLFVESIQGVNIYKPNEGEIMIKPELYTDISCFKLKHTMFQNETSYISIIYILYILYVASGTVIDQKKIGFKQIRNFYYKLADRTRSAPSKELTSYKKLTQTQVDNVLDAIANTAMKKYFSMSSGFKENFQLFSTWLNQYSKCDTESVKEETLELKELFLNQKLEESVFHYWSSQINLPKEIYDAHTNATSQSAASNKFSRKQSLHAELEAIANYQPRHLLPQESD